MRLERWLSTGDAFDTPYEQGCKVAAEADERGFFLAIDSHGAFAEFHTDAVVAVRRPVAGSCPAECPRCGLDLAQAGRPRSHQTWDTSDMCSFTWAPVGR